MTSLRATNMTSLRDSNPTYPGPDRGVLYPMCSNPSVKPMSSISPNAAGVKSVFIRSIRLNPCPKKSSVAHGSTNITSLRDSNPTVHDWSTNITSLRDSNPTAHDWSTNITSLRDSNPTVHDWSTNMTSLRDSNPTAHDCSTNMTSLRALPNAH